MNVGVLGCGPSGLVAAHAAKVAGAAVTVYSRKRKSEMFGAQYLHAPIPGMTVHPPVTVHVEMLGSHAQYRNKVYGEQAGSVATVSTEDLPTMHDAWNIRDTYENLWNAYSGNVVDWDARGQDSVALDFLLTQHDIVFSTIPAPLLCRRPEAHAFLSQPIWALGDAPERGMFVVDNVHTVRNTPENTIVCNGEVLPTWYRAANVFGRMTVEWPADARSAETNVAAKEASLVSKPISTNCDCWPQVKRLGRYGEWRKGVLVHHAYEDAMAAVVSSSHG